MIDPSVLDLARLREIYGDDRAGMLDLLELVVATAQTQLESLEAAVASRDAAAIRSAAHAIKGASLNVGAGEASRSAAQLEASATAQQWDKIPAETVSLKEACARLEEVIATFSREG